MARVLLLRLRRRGSLTNRLTPSINMLMFRTLIRAWNQPIPRNPLEKGHLGGLGQ
jgi:hypothetical protein